VLLIPFNVHTLSGIDLHSPHLSSPWHANAVRGILDFVNLLLISACLATFRYRFRVRPPGIVLVGAVAVAGISLIGLVISPSPNGVMLTLRLIAAGAIVYAARLMGAALFDRYVVTAIKITASSQAVWALWQSYSGTGMVLYTSKAGHGSFNGPYEMTAFLTLAIVAVAWSARLHTLRSWDYAVIGISSAAIATAFGRTGVLTVLVVAGAYGIGWVRTRSTELAWIGGFTALPMIFVAVVLHTGWQERASQTLSNLDSGRLELMGQAVLVIREHPVFGVGPGQYGPALTDLPPEVIDHVMVHAVPLLVAAEFGIVAGIAFLSWLIVNGVRSLRVSIHSIALFCAVVPYLFLDSLHYVLPMGVTMFGIWLAALDSDRLLCERDRDGPKRSMATEPSPDAIQTSFDA